jgi:hypothetical protein
MMVGNSAIISDCELFRYELSRVWSDEGPLGCVIMVNPSTADADDDDATIRKLKGFATLAGWGGFIVVNKFAYRATDVNALNTIDDPTGPFNSGHVAAAMIKCDVAVVAWGSLGKLPLRLRGQWRNIVRIADAMEKPLHCWATCQDGHPRHPVMLGYDKPLKLWSAPQ